MLITFFSATLILSQYLAVNLKNLSFSLHLQHNKLHNKCNRDEKREYKISILSAFSAIT